MIKNCVIYKYSDQSMGDRRIDRESFCSNTLEQCLSTSSGSARRRIQDLKSWVRNERMSVDEETGSHEVIRYTCEFRVPQLIASGTPPPFVPVDVRLWVRKKSLFVVTFDAGRRLSGGAIALLSYITTGDAAAIEPIKLEKRHFLKLKDSLPGDTERGRGDIRNISMQGIEGDRVNFKKIILNAPNLQESPLFDQFLDSASGVASLTFASAPLEATSRSVVCRINYWGSLTIYSSNLLDSEIDEIIGILESVMQ